ncbi:MAG: cell division protein FtsL [Selenomonadaceae bacterium]|nr:cell division protein FtsL [Selenomonadaceae bacterium]
MEHRINLMGKNGRPHRSMNWFLILLVVIVVYFASIFLSQAMHLKQVSADQLEAEVRLQQAQQENARLKKEKDDLGKLDYIEKIAREELGMTKHGELPYQSGRPEQK